MAASVSLFLCGDVMLGRGIDQVLARPGDPGLREPHIRDAREYVRLAEEADGSVPAPVEPDYPWGEALQELEGAAPDARVVNVETAITRSGDFATGKSVHYRMHPGNIACLDAARPDACALANNHVLDFGRAGLAETLDALEAAGLRAAGAGRDLQQARRPAVVPLPEGRRLLVFSFGTPSSGIPPDWAAGRDRPGVDLATDPAAGAAARAERIGAAKRPGDVAVASVHWGSNWGYGIEPEQSAAARALIDGGADVVHGHSSHHPRPIEIYRGRLVLYGCGDLVNDYEGIPPDAHGRSDDYRGDLRLLYFASLEPGTGALTGLRMVPLRARRMRLERAGTEDARWLRERLECLSRGFGVRVRPEPDGAMAAIPAMRA